MKFSANHSAQIGDLSQNFYLSIFEETPTLFVTLYKYVYGTVTLDVSDSRFANGDILFSMLLTFTQNMYVYRYRHRHGKILKLKSLHLIHISVQINIYITITTSRYSL